MTEVITFNQVSKSYPGVILKQAISDISFKVSEGEFFCLVGPSGCGKSTILKIVAGLEQPSGGTVQKPTNLGMVFQSGALLPWLTVRENVAFGLQMKGISLYQVDEVAKKYIKMVGLEGLEDKYPRELSGGQRQRVGIARALAIEPKVLLLDEPFSALDPLTTEILHEDLLKIWKELNLTILMVSHLLEEAVMLADNIGVMGYGKLVEVVEDKLPRPRDEDTQEFQKKVKTIMKILEAEDITGEKVPTYTRS